MDKILDVYEKQLKKEQDGLDDVLQELTPLEKKKAAFEENIKALKQLIVVEKERAKPDVKANAEIELPAFAAKATGRMMGKAGLEAYKELSSVDLKDKSFRENDIRELANKEGLLINDKFISSSYSRALLVRLIEQDFLEKVENKRGFYRYKEQRLPRRLDSSPDS
jgi:predicted CopG family antitoxin